MSRILHKISAPTTTKSAPYQEFEHLDGWHLWQTAVPKGCVLYPARKLQKGQVLYFNFALAKEMGLIPAKHKNKLNKALEKKIIETFCLRIVNEYDEKQNVRYHPTILKEKPFMATRYLQMQHSDKRGRTSGDGRSIWNGQVSFRGKTWDVSSRGTGVTRLSPGAVQADAPLKSGSTNFGYGCGMADIDELIGAAIMAEIFHNNGIKTERVLAVIDIGGGNAIGVRAAPNLFRPAHLFSFLKQGDLENLKKATDFIIHRQIQNGAWNITSKSRFAYKQMLENVIQDFARFTARLDREYIFAWLDWDGDNVLIDGGIIDYGSIRQFGLRHDQYRYDDVERFSTTLNEQKNKSLSIVQTFAQLTDFLESGIKKPIEQFANHSCKDKFEKIYQEEVLNLFLTQVGLAATDCQLTNKQHNRLINKMYFYYRKLESTKTHMPIKKVPDGLNRPAILNMRKLLSELPEEILKKSTTKNLAALTAQEMFSLCLANSAKGKDKKLRKTTKHYLQKFQELYLELIQNLSAGKSTQSQLKKIAKRASRNNREGRMTGDALLYVVEEILKKRRSAQFASVTQAAIDKLIKEQSPNSTLNIFETLEPSEQNSDRHTARLMATMISLIDGHKESI